MSMRRRTVITATVVAVASVATIAGVVSVGAASYAEAVNRPTVPSAYRSSKAASFPGSRFADEMMKTSIDGSGLKDKSTDGATMIPDSCDAGDFTDSMLYMRSGTSPSWSMNVQVYGAGQARRQYDSYVGAMKTCGVGYNAATRGSIQYAAWDGGYVMTEGDSIISVSTPDHSRTMSTASTIMDAMDRNMGVTNCLSTSEDADDVHRSFYYDAKSYTGLMRQEQVSATKNTISLTVPQNLKNAGESMDTLFPDPMVRAAPEGPLPKGMQSALPQTPAKPKLDASVSAPERTSSLTYQVKDPSGPGCGWEWSGQKIPTFNQQLLQSRYDKARSNAITGLDSAVLSYNGWAASWSMTALLDMRFVNTWNQYRNSVKSVTDSWNGLDSARQSFKPKWDAYLQSVYQWEYNRDSSKDADDAWNSKVSSCVSDKENQWKSQQKDQSAKPGDDQESQWKTDCQNSTPKPDDSGNAAEPSAPTPPDNVTIPQSWSTRDDMVKAADADYAAEQAKEKAQEQDKTPAQPAPKPSPSPSPSPSSPSPSPSPKPSPSNPDNPSPSPDNPPAPSPSPKKNR